MGTEIFQGYLIQVEGLLIIPGIVLSNSFLDILCGLNALISVKPSIDLKGTCQKGRGALAMLSSSMQMNNMRSPDVYYDVFEHQNDQVRIGCLHLLLSP